MCVLENSIDSLIAQAQAKNIEINFGNEEAIWVNGNAELIERAMINLLSNAIKYSPENTLITIEVTTLNEHVIIKIIDQGFGIDEHELPHIFKRFHRQKTSEIHGEKGAGLGLNFVQVVIEKHQGEIAVESIPHSGTTFTVSLPFKHIE